jgi:hypothetical protein
MAFLRRARRFLGVVWLAANQTVNTLIGGDPQMTMSARAGYARERGSRAAAGACRFLDVLDLRDGDAPEGDHCDIAVRNYEARIKASKEKIDDRGKGTD